MIDCFNWLFVGGFSFLYCNEVVFPKSSSLLIAGCRFGMSFAYPSTDVVV